MGVAPNRLRTAQEIIGDGLNYVIDLGDIPEYDKEDYNLTDPKDAQKYIYDVEKFVRNSFEYHIAIAYLRQYMDMNKCAFFENVNNIDTTSIHIEIHHSPFTLYEITETVIRKRTFYNESLLIEDTAREVIYLHYCLIVGLIPLSETVHELVHNQFLFVPTDKVMGDYKKFVELYKPWMNDNLLKKIKQMEDYTATYNMEENASILQRGIVNLEYTDKYTLPSYDQLKLAMESRAAYLKDHGYKQPALTGVAPLITVFNEAPQKKQLISIL